MIELKKIDKNKLMFFGDLKYTKSKLKTVNVDSEIYSKTEYIDCHNSLCNIRANKEFQFTDIDYNFKHIDYKITIQDTQDFTLSRCNDESIIYSNNEVANLIMYAFENGLLDKRILSVFNTKVYKYYPVNYNDEWDNILKTSRVRLFLFGYGFNNSICYEVSLKTLFNINVELIPKDVISIFNHFGINLKNKNKFTEIIKLTKKIINKHDTSKQQIFNSFSI